MPLKKRGRPTSVEVRKAFQVMLLEREKRLLKAAMKREGGHSLSAWIASKALHAAKEIR